MSNSTFNAIVMRYSDKEGHVRFDDFVACVIKLRTMFGKEIVLQVLVVIVGWGGVGGGVGGGVLGNVGDWRQRRKEDVTCLLSYLLMHQLLNATRQIHYAQLLGLFLAYCAVGHYM